MGLQIADVRPPPRIWFIHAKEDGIIQIERDRFLHNWRKVRPEDEYPRYHNVIELFRDGLSLFESFLEENELGIIEPFQYEMTYVNHIPQGSGWTKMNELGNAFPDFALRASEQRFYPSPKESIGEQCSYYLIVRVDCT